MNVTPLVDVVLVLLIIFMVVTPQLEAGAAVELPAARHPDKVDAQQLEPTTVSVTARGELYVDRDPVTRERLAEALKQKHQAAPNKPVQVKADRAARYADVRSVFKACQDTGFPGVSLQVAEQKP